MDVWHRSGSKAVAEYQVSESSYLVVGFFGPGTPVGQFDRFQVLDVRTGEQIAGPAKKLFNLPSADEVANLVKSSRYQSPISDPGAGNTREPTTADYLSGSRPGN